MKIVVIGGTGLIGSPLVKMLQERGQEAVAASPSKGVNAVTGEGLAAALAGAYVVVDVANSPSFDDEPVTSFFEASTRNLLAAEATAGVKHHVALSVVGTDRLPSSGYFRAKLKQETLIKAGPIPYTILRATQFFEFIATISYSGGSGQVVHLPTALMQPIAAGDVSARWRRLPCSRRRTGCWRSAGRRNLRCSRSSGGRWRRATTGARSWAIRTRLTLGRRLTTSRWWRTTAV